MTEQDRVNNAMKNVDERKREKMSTYGIPGEMSTRIMLMEKLPETKTLSVGREALSKLRAAISK